MMSARPRCDAPSSSAGRSSTSRSRDVLADLDEGRLSPRASAAASFIETLARDPKSVSADDVERAHTAGVDQDALAEAIYVAFMFNTINRVADALDFEHRSDRGRRRGAEVLRRRGYRPPGAIAALTRRVRTPELLSR